MKALIAMIVLLSSVSAFSYSSNDSYRMVETSDSFTMETLKPGAPEAIVEEFNKEKTVNKNASLTKAMKIMEDQCIDKNWGNPTQMDVVSVDTKPELSGSYITFTVTVTAVCK